MATTGQPRDRPNLIGPRPAGGETGCETGFQRLFIRLAFNGFPVSLAARLAFNGFTSAARLARSSVRSFLFSWVVVQCDKSAVTVK